MSGLQVTGASLFDRNQPANREALVAQHGRPKLTVQRGVCITAAQGFRESYRSGVHRRTGRHVLANERGRAS